MVGNDELVLLTHLCSHSCGKRIPKIEQIKVM